MSSSSGYFFNFTPVPIAMPVVPTHFPGWSPYPAAATSNQQQQVADLVRKLSGGKYEAVRVSWNDSTRFTDPNTGALSTVGPNITDAQLQSADSDGQAYHTIRQNNFTDPIGMVSLRELALMVSESSSDELKPITLAECLANFAKYCKYTGIDETDGFFRDADELVSVRFSYACIPGRGALEKHVIPWNYSYNTPSDEAPRNLILQCTAQGLSVNQDRRGAQRLYLHHERKCYDYKVTPTRFGLDEKQEETQAEIEANIQKGEANAGYVGLKCMGKTFNTFMTIQIPIQQPPLQPAAARCGGGIPKSFSLGSSSSSGQVQIIRESYQGPLLVPHSQSLSSPNFLSFGVVRNPEPEQQQLSNTTSAGRVSVGKFVKNFEPLPLKQVKRASNQPITVTIMLFGFVDTPDGVPSEADIVKVIEKLNYLYEQVKAKPRVQHHEVQTPATPQAIQFKPMAADAPFPTF